MCISVFQAPLQGLEMNPGLNSLCYNSLNEFIFWKYVILNVVFLAGFWFKLADLVTRLCLFSTTATTTTTTTTVTCWPAFGYFYELCFNVMVYHWVRNDTNWRHNRIFLNFNKLLWKKSILGKKLKVLCSYSCQHCDVVISSMINQLNPPWGTKLKATQWGHQLPLVSFLPLGDQPSTYSSRLVQCLGVPSAYNDWTRSFNSKLGLWPLLQFLGVQSLPFGEQHKRKSSYLSWSCWLIDKNYKKVITSFDCQQ